VLYAFEEEHEPTTVKRPASKPAAKKEEDKRLRLTNNLDGGKQDILTDFILSSFEPLKRLDTTKIRLYDKQFKTSLPITISKDTTNKKILLKHSWAEGIDYNLILEKDFAADTMENKYNENRYHFL